MRKLSLLKSIQSIIIITLVISSVLYFTTSIYSRYRHFNDEIKERRIKEISTIKNILKSEVGHVVDHIAFLRSDIRDRTKVEAKNRVYEAHRIAEHLYLYYKNKVSSSQLKIMIKEALRPIRFDDGNGYYFITKLDGIEILFADRPEMEGKNLIDTRDTNGKAVIVDMIDIIKKSDEGFYSYTWTKPNKSGASFEKIAYVKKFKPYDWFIGTGVYIDDINELIKREALKQIKKTRFGENKREYIFAGEYNGTSLSGPAVGKNMFNTKDANGVMIVQELINSSKAGGGFVEYVMPKLEGHKPDPKISYAQGIDEWQWYIGAGVYIDEIEDRIDLLKKRSRKNFIKNIYTIFGVTLGIIILFLFIMNYMSKHLGRDISKFNSFFKNIAEQNQKIIRENIRFLEFDSMAEYANRMLFEKVSAEKSLKKSEDQFKMLFSEAPIGIVLEDKDFNIILSNNSFQNMVGYSEEELMNKNVQDFSVEKDQTEDFKLFNDLLSRKKSSYNLEKRYEHKDGSIVWGYITRTLIFSEEDQPLWSIVMIEDLTERKKLQDQIRQAEKMETIGQLAGGIAHDFNNQLAGIMGFAELLNDMTKDNNELQKYTEFILNSVKNSAELTAQLLAFARKGKVQSISVDIHKVIDEVNSLLKHSLHKNITLVQNLNAKKSNIKGDPTQIQNAVLNLAINARDAMPEGGEITISTALINISQLECAKFAYNIEPGEYLKVSISDTGIGMSTEIQEKIFEPFFTTKELGKGTGMGLAAVYGTVKNHKGAISVSSEKGEGTTFEIFLPIHVENELKANKGTDESSIMGEGLILLVDDEEMLRNMGSKLLENLGYSVQACCNGQEAVDYYEKNWSKVSLVILDMVMPVMGGKDAFLLMKDINPSVNVILASGYSIEGEAENLLKNGVKGFLQKPFRKVEFSKIVSEAINS